MLLQAKGYIKMADFNRVIMVGNLTRDPEVRQLPSGQSLCRLGLASNRQYKNRQSGQTVQEVCFVDIDVWGPQADSCQKYLQKGRSVLIEGRLKLDSWVDKEGQKRSKHSIVADRVVFLSSSQMASSVDDSSVSQFDDSGLQEQQQESKETKQEAFSAQSSKTSSKVLFEEQSEGFVTGKEDKLEASGINNTGEIQFKDQKPFEDDLPF